MRQLATIQTVLSKKPISGADKIEVVQVKGWEVVAKKDEFNVGDKVIYVEIDSKLPDKIYFDFMRSRNFKVKTIKLKGQVSQGIVFPLTILPTKVNGYNIEEDVTELLGITNYKDDEEIKDSVDSRKFSWLNVLYKYKLTRSLAKLLTFKAKKEAFPSFIKKTDEDRIQNKSRFYYTIRDSKVSASEKLDGQSGTFFLRKSWFKKEFGVCSRNLHLKTKHPCNWWNIAEKYGFEDKLKKLNGDIYIQGEIVGEGIQKNKYKLTGHKFYLFNAFLIKSQEYLNYDELVSLANWLGCEVVPKVEVDLSDLNEENFINKMVERSKGFSKLNDKVIREGIVIREDVLEYKNSIKVINPDFLLKHDE
ncbi:MAG TPA: RNA ligase family protein [Patescibacteria group bacterium]|nr:RNA ligase family protein [Patescibacteria group bacterium]